MSKKNVFLLLGQSNMVGLGNLDKSLFIENKQISVFNDNKWSTAKEPLHLDNPNAGIGLAMSFANQLITNSQKVNNISLIPLAVASTSINDWMPYSVLYDRIFTTLKSAEVKYDEIKGILWHHGESESKNILRASSYADRLKFIIRYLRKDLNYPELPIISGELGGFLDHRFPFSDIVNDQLHTLENQLKSFKVASSIDLSSNKDMIHLNSESLIELGKRYASKFQMLTNE
ncbi:sialate O-acetylesterase [Francisella sp. Scap27]|uniref:sialate O-acetylesterase n=1 Tax=Francisella sp. Scap27 TaxID=2589986 RepID=UPI0015BC8E66|nr:sialate O-acetylesterase [Francisella sp. Scap27]QLE79071.1 sialate O-acetylesterase [Francisella sp. Scap27]